MKYYLSPSHDEIVILSEEDLSFDEEIDVASEITEKLGAQSAKTINNSDFDATRAYLNELGRSKLLTADQEKNLWRARLARRPASTQDHD
jgi:RNA polymerase nonessential primary-like sigma factor